MTASVGANKMACVEEIVTADTPHFLIPQYFHDYYDLCVPKPDGNCTRFMVIVDYVDGEFVGKLFAGPGSTHTELIGAGKINSFLPKKQNISGIFKECFYMGYAARDPIKPDEVSFKPGAPVVPTSQARGIQ